MGYSKGIQQEVFIKYVCGYTPKEIAEESLGYGDRTIYMVNSIWRDLGQFLGNRSKVPFLPIYGLEYLHDRIGYPECLQRELTSEVYRRVH